MIPVRISGDESPEELHEKIKAITEDLDDKLSQLNDHIYDFVRNEPKQRQVITAVGSDDLITHEDTYDHTDLHTRLHAMNGSSDHNSPSGTEDNLVDFDANGYPVGDSGSSVADIKDCDNHTSGSTNFVLAQQAAEADLSQSISDPPTQAEVQAISDKIDALLAKLRTANVLAT